jgi:hypothetical protein
MGFVYNRGARNLLNGTTVYTTATIKARLALTTYTPDKDSTAMTGIGVVGNDFTLLGKTQTEDLVNDRIVFDANDFTFPAQASGAQCDKIILFHFSVDDAGSVPLAFVPMVPVVPNGGDIAISIDPAGLFYVQQ